MFSVQIEFKIFSPFYYCYYFFFSKSDPVGSGFNLPG